MLPETLQVARVLHEERIATATKREPEGWIIQVPNLFDRMWERLRRAKWIRVRPETPPSQQLDPEISPRAA